MKKRMYYGLLAAVFAVGMGAGCGGAKSSAASDASYAAADYDSASWDESYWESADEGYTDGLAESAETAAAAGSVTGNASDNSNVTILEEKLVYYCDMSIETTEYEQTLAGIRSMIEKYGGIIQSENETDSSYNWYYEDYRKTSGTMSNYLQIRVPSASYAEFVNELDGVGKVVSKSTSVDNISQEYYDTTVQIEALQTQEESLLAMLKSCESIEDMITVQDRLTEVQYQLNRLTTNLRYMDTDVAYSYVNISVEEVMEYHYEEPVRTNTFGNRLKNTVRDTWDDFVEFLEWALFTIIHLIPYAILLGICRFIFRKPIAKWKEKRKAKKQEKMLR